MAKPKQSKPTEPKVNYQRGVRTYKNANGTTVIDRGDFAGQAAVQARNGTHMPTGQGPDMGQAAQQDRSAEDIVAEIKNSKGRVSGGNVSNGE